jgi:hypothetical protein
LVLHWIKSVHLKIKEKIMFWNKLDQLNVVIRHLSNNLLQSSNVICMAYFNAIKTFWHIATHQRPFCIFVISFYFSNS